MHWIIQENDHEPAITDLIDCLDRADIPRTIVKVIPFVGEIIPDVEVKDGKAIVIGSYSMRHVAKRKGWTPGSFDLADITYAQLIERWGAAHMLNSDAIYCAFADAPTHIGDQPFFLRPTVDSKFFSGAVFDRDEFMAWRHKVVALEEDTGNSLRGSTEVMIAKPKAIRQEHRVFIVDGKAVTASLYKIGGRVRYAECIDRAVLDYAEARAAVYAPARAFVMDVADTADGFKIIETNTLNAAGLYACNIGKLVGALEELSRS